MVVALAQRWASRVGPTYAFTLEEPDRPAIAVGEVQTRDLIVVLRWPCRRMGDERIAGWASGGRDLNRGDRGDRLAEGTCPDPRSIK